MQKQTNNAAMIRLLDNAISQFASPGSAEVNEEHLAMLCMGRIDELSAAERFILLRQIASDPEMAQLVAQMREMGWGEDEHPASTFPDVILRITPIAWSMAACLAVALGVWRFAGSTPNIPNTSVAMKTNQNGGSSLPMVSNPLGGADQSQSLGNGSGLAGAALGNSQVNTGQNPTTAPSNLAPALPPAAAQHGASSANTPAAQYPPAVQQSEAAQNSWQFGDWLAISAIILAAILTIPGIYWITYRWQRRAIAP